MASSSTFAAMLVVLGGLVRPGCGNAFLSRQEMGGLVAQALNASAIESVFLDEVRGFVGKGPMDVQLPAIQKALQPMWLALPKDRHGRLGNAQARYALHRFFVQRHGWHIDGLDRIADESSSPANLLKDRAPTFIMDLFEEAFGQTGLLFHELAIFAAVLERIIHDDATGRLKDVYEALQMPMHERVSVSEADEAVKAYMMSLLLGQEKLKTDLAASYSRLQRNYPAWSSTLLWLRDVRETVAYMERGGTNPFVAERGLSFVQVERVVQQVSERLGSFQDVDCRQLRDTLLESEDRDSGRLLLSDFYKKGLETVMQFVERPEYLRQLGALDESMPGEARVIVSNYILSKSNCLSDMGFYSICCINECESLMAHLEQVIAAPFAKPELIAAVVANLSTSTVDAPRVLQPSAVRRLEQVAMRNGGTVPLHGRLFAQWLHLAFPRECPYPHTAGTTSPLTAAEWMAVNAGNSNMKRHDIDQYIGARQEMPPSADEDDEVLTRWSDEEEILYLPVELPPTWPAALLRALLAFGVFLCVSAAVAEVGRRLGGSASGKGLSAKAHLV